MSRDRHPTSQVIPALGAHQTTAANQELPTPGITAALAEAMACHRNGQLHRAEQLYRQVIQIDPRQPEALNLLGLVAYQHGQHADAADWISRAISVNPEVASFHNNLGLAFQALRKIDRALACYRRALAINPNDADAHYNRGNALTAQGKPEEAASCFLRAVELKPDFAKAHHNLAGALAKQKRLEQAAAHYRWALELRPDYTEAHANLGTVLHEQGDFDEAVACFRRALAIQPNCASAHNNLGCALTKQGHFAAAAACHQRALELKPDDAEACHNLGTAWRKQGKLAEAVACYRQTLELKPDYADAHNNLGTTLQAQGKLDEAMASYQAALQLEPGHADAHNNLGTALLAQGNVEEAVACYHRAFECQRDHVEAHFNLGTALQRQGRVDEALALYRRALELDPEHPDANWNQALLHLLQGDFSRGWAGYEWRWRTEAKHRLARGFTEPLWDGKPLAGKTILLHAEQGFGDTIQFIRYAPLAHAMGGRVVVECQPELAGLLRCCRGIDVVVGRGQPLPSFDAQVPLLSLPWLFDTSLETIPAEIPYLHADAELVERWRSRLGDGGDFKIGIAWRGNPLHPGDRFRSSPLSCFSSLARLPGVRLFSLQKGSASADIESCGDQLPVTDLGEQISDFADTAAIMSQLNLVISCDSAPAHLAGALGRPVWVPLPFAPDWRWMLDRDDSPWYPTMRLFRQQDRGNWDRVFGRIEAALSELLDQHG